MQPLVKKSYSAYCRLRFSQGRISIVLPPIPSENLGDQAMVLGAIAELRHRGSCHAQLITSGPRFDFDLDTISPVRLSDRHQFFCSERSFYEECGLIKDFAQSFQLLVFGADVLDGHYGESRHLRTFAAIKRAVELNVPVRVIGFSISDTPSPDAISFFRDYSEHVELYPRDPVSMRRLSDAGATNLTLGADVAFLMPTASDTMVSDEVKTFFGAFAGNVLGISLHSNFFGKEPEQLVRYMVEVFGELAKHENFGLLFVPHHPADLDYFQLLEKECPAALRTRCHFVTEFPSAPVAKRMFACCRHVLSSRMHVAIAALSTQTPVTCFPYYGKFEGLFEHFRLSDSLIYANKFPPSPAGLAEVLIARIANGPEIRDRIASRLPAVVELSQRNFCATPNSGG